MRNLSEMGTDVTVGIDLGDKINVVVVLDAAGEVILRDRVPCTREDMKMFFMEQLCKEKYPETGILRAITGVGPQVSLGFVLTLEDPERYKSSRTVGAFLGLTPRRHQSGEIDKQMRITKAGNGFMRRLLVNSSNYILGAFGPDCDLRRFGQRIEGRGGKSPKRRARVAVARKLAVLMHSMWLNGTEYQPLGYGKKVS